MPICTVSITLMLVPSYDQCIIRLGFAVQVNASSSMVDAAVMGLQLDELELASLRGEVQEVSLSLNFDTRMGRGKVNVAGPRFSGLQGEALSGGVRWERDVIRLEKAVLQQRSSRWRFFWLCSLNPESILQ